MRNIIQKQWIRHRHRTYRIKMGPKSTSHSCYLKCPRFSSRLHSPPMSFHFQISEDCHYTAMLLWIKCRRYYSLQHRMCSHSTFKHLRPSGYPHIRWRYHHQHRLLGPYLCTLKIFLTLKRWLWLQPNKMRRSQMCHNGRRQTVELILLSIDPPSIAMSSSSFQMKILFFLF